MHAKKIRIHDPTDAMPHLFGLHDRFEKCTSDPDVEIHSAWCADDQVAPSDVFTIFVNTEANMDTASTEFQINQELRPNSVFAVTAFSKSNPWPVPTIDFLSHIYFTYRSNETLKPLNVGFKSRDGCALFGGWETGRENLFKRLRDLDLVNRCFITLQVKLKDDKRFSPEELAEKIYYQSPEIRELDTLEFNRLAYSEKGMFTMYMHTNNRYMFVSQIVPYDMYDRCYLNIVAETENFGYQDCIFLTEKIAKPLVAGQPFLVYARAKGFLAYLKSQGFRTFDQWIDESYDNIENGSNILRANTVIDSFSQFAKQPSLTKLRALIAMQEVCDHNRRLATDPAFLLAPIADLILQRFS
jgi:hypothetical protein